MKPEIQFCWLMKLNLGWMNDEWASERINAYSNLKGKYLINNDCKGNVINNK